MTGEFRPGPFAASDKTPSRTESASRLRERQWLRLASVRLAPALSIASTSSPYEEPQMTNEGVRLLRGGGIDGAEGTVADQELKR